MPPAATDIPALNKALTGFTDLIRFDLSADHEHHRYDLILTLLNPKKQKLTLICQDVSNLELNPTGDDFRTLRRLQISDLSADKLDRIHYAVEELDSESLFLHCAEIRLQDY